MTTNDEVRPDVERDEDLVSHIEKRARDAHDILREAGPMSLAGLARRIEGATTNEVAMALGWLAREGAVRFRRRGGIWEMRLERQEEDTGKSPTHPDWRCGDE